jgi:hypothetical protein
MIKQMDMEEQFIMTEVIMKDDAKKVWQKDLEKKFGQMAKHILVNGNKIIEMDLENNF